MAEEVLGADVKGAFGIAVFFTLVAIAIGDETIGMLISPIVILAILYVLVRAPLRTSLLGIMFVSLTIENPAENPGAGHFQSPFWTLGALLLTHLNKTVAIPVLGSMSGVDLMLIVLLLVALARRQSGSKIDRAGRIATPEPLVQLAVISLLGIVWILMVGIFRGGDTSMALWQIDKVIHLPIIFLLFHMGLRGQKDHLAIARVVVGAAVTRALFAIYIVNVVDLPLDENGQEQRLGWATSHHDSILFAVAFVILVSFMMERVRRGTTRLALLLLPILAGGMYANNRRMVWVQVAMVFVTLYLATPLNPTKRKIKLAAFASSPLTLIYLAAGWDSKAGIFKPVQVIRSVVDPQSDGSTLWREMENFDILYTFRQYWLLGTGYGNGYWEIIPLPAIDYALEKYIPHNSILGLWCYCGYLGYTALTLLWGAGAYFSMRAYLASKQPTDRVAALACLGAVLVYMIQCYGDMGLGSWTGVFIVGAAIAVSGKLAVAVGAWPAQKASKKATKAEPVRATVEGQIA